MKCRELIINPEEIKKLYLANQWTAYTNDFDTLLRAFPNSLDCYGAYEDGKLVGLIRTVGDGVTIIYIQDLLVLPEYQRKGIGKCLINKVLSKYPYVRQILLTTDKEIWQKKFYESLGFVEYETMDLKGFRLKR